MGFHKLVLELGVWVWLVYNQNHNYDALCVRM